MRVPAILLVALVPLLFLSSCKKEAEQAQDDQQVFTAKPIADPDDQLRRDAATKLTEQFSTTLKSELMAAINAGGVASAVDVCSKRAPEIAKSFAGSGWSIRRVSTRSRNPENIADSAAAIMLRRFARDTTNPIISVVERVEGQHIYTMYKPIYVADLCLNCHGDASKFDPQLVQALARNYPSDQATGYKVGDLRGLFVVSAVWPQGKARAQELVQAAQ